jgi:hypothetical protein
MMIMIRRCVRRARALVHKVNKLPSWWWQQVAARLQENFM